ncbi:MAG: hypothetical protein K0Q76_1877 [Panacagrimonas sp.]|nr:hypothetical protein [Panacagrimonas sp.]MCC2656769.1 hypothetical protein [Panacagrimonas sp.]
MAICDSCKRLAATSKRAAVPAHLMRLESGSAADRHRAHYRCLSCQSQWRWVAPTTWVLILPPVSAADRSVDKAGWWMALGQLFAGTRAGRRAPIDLRAPRLAANRRAMTPVVIPSDTMPAPAPVDARANDERV